MLMMAAPSHAVPLDVVGRTTLRVDWHTIGQELVISGRATDDLGRGVPFRRVRVEGTASDAAFRAEAVTDAAGGFEVRRIVGSGEWTVRVHFAGDLFTEGDEHSIPVEVRSLTAQVEVLAPTIVPVSEGSAPLGVHVTVGGRPAVGAPVRFNSECGTVPGGAAVAVDGFARGDFVFADGAIGPCDVYLVIEGQRRFTSVSASTQIRRIEAPTVRVSGQFERGGPFLDGEWLVRVEAFDRYGTLDGAQIDLLRDGDTLAGARLDGSAALFRVSESEIGARSEVVAVLVPDVGELRLTTEPLVLVRPPSPSRVFGFWSVALASALALIIVVGIVREVRRARPETTRRAPAVAGVVQESAPDRGDGVIEILVRDVEDGRPLGGAIVRADDGAQWTTSDDGRLTVPPFDRLAFEAQADGYLPLRGTIRRPEGQKRAVIQLKSVRAEVRDVLRAAIERLNGPKSPWWGRRTTWRVTEETIRSLRTLRMAPTREATHRAELNRLFEATADAHGEAEALEALALLVDDVYFGGGGGRDTVALAEQLSAVSRRLK